MADQTSGQLLPPSQLKEKQPIKTAMNKTPNYHLFYK
jgi:hypothetical protein